MTPIYLSVTEHPECAGMADVYLDGALVVWASAAHEGEGWVDRHWMDELGRPITTLPPQRGTGRVEIRPKGGATRADLERIAASPALVRMAYIGTDGETYHSYPLARREAEDLVTRMRQYYPGFSTWVVNQEM